MNVRLALGEGTSVKFGFCTQCEWRGWDREGLKVPLSSILGLLASR